MAKIINHPHWNNDTWDSPAEHAQQSPTQLNTDDLIITSPGGIAPDTRTDAEKRAESGAFTVKSVPDSSTLIGGIVSNVTKANENIDKTSKVVDATRADVTTNQQKIRKVESETIPNLEAKMYANNDRFVHELSSLDADIRNRFDLLPDGYISVFSDTTIFANSGFLGLVQDFFGTGTPISQQLERLIPFNQQFGPSKGARLDVTNRRLVFEEAGTWLVSARATADTPSTGFGVPNNNRMTWAELAVYNRNDEKREHRDCHMHAPVSATLQLVEAVVIPEPGYSVRLWVRSNEYRSWLGGLNLNALTAVLLTPKVAQQNNSTVRDENDKIMKDNADYEKRLRRRH